MIRLIKNIILYRRFQKALRLCRKQNANRQADRYIVANICGQPYVINRSAFRRLRTKGVFRADLKWSEITARQVTTKTLKQWIS